MGRARNSGERTQAIPVTLCFVRAGGRILLLRTAPTKDRFRGLWNGIGGHVHPGEDVREAAARELREETGLQAGALRLGAVIHEVGLLGHAHLLFAFVAEIDAAAARRIPLESREGRLAWFDPEAIPWDEAVPDLRELLPRVLEADEPIFGTQTFDGADGSVELRLS